MQPVRTSESVSWNRLFAGSWRSVASFMQLSGPADEGIQVRLARSGRVRLGVSGIQMSMGRFVIQRGGPLQSMDDAFVRPQFRGFGYEEERSVFNRTKGSCVTRHHAATRMLCEPARIVRAKSFTLQSTRKPWRIDREMCTATGTLA